MAKIDQLASSMHVNMHIDEDERSSLLNYDLLDETDDEDPTEVLMTTNMGKEVAIHAVSKTEEKAKFVPKNRITGPLLHVPQPMGRQPAQARLETRSSTSHSRKSVKDRLVPYTKRNASTSPSMPSPVPAPIRPTPATASVRASNMLSTVPGPLYTLPPIFFPTPPPPMPKYTDFMLSTLSNTLMQHSQDSFSIKLNKSEVEEFLKTAKKEYCF